ncbi:FAD-binding and (Fe-S)-binding domain-containing protein [Actinacidiphila bryophytorum]|uniref:FAD/FMN-containing dehydrogenase n=1 Tax=Actinacidiphila bryophytorum TaxID=1436133 RepID=A0A9W4H2P8_9ACTN|nr:FAD-binding and (Fe-S)-binding domain-containing protein [Actinacidiphila bryophytorum]MBM9436968.1 FAD-binding protein [Actinacidiphila bryophytorum]MBN6542423.1 FAD-binding protein [Actinacidiphila bryophytorum]CAG7646018.1 FAD/FMN-containing dehydrogenase [Actinacidiphila bryophytorum]
MSTVERPTPTAADSTQDLAALEEALRAEVAGEVRFDAGSRGAYATDGSNYRQVPLGVVVPRDVEAGAAAVAVCARFGAPLLSRGGGTSLAGQCTNAAVVIDWTKYCDGVVSVDPEARTCIVEPGVVLDDLNRQLAACGLMFGPKPSTHSHCTVGGMVGNNSCGASAQAYGKTVDNVRRLEILTYDGVRCWVGRTSPEDFDAMTALGDRRAELYAGMRRIGDRHLADIRRGFPKIPRRVSGYNLDDLLPENGFHVARALVGSEGTLVTVLHAELELVPVPAADAMLILGYPDICAAADDVQRVLANSSPAQLEALDDRMAQLMHEEGSHTESLRTFPEGGSWLLLQFTGDDQQAADRQAEELLHALGRSKDDPDVALSDDTAREQRMLKAREAGLGVTARPPDERETWEGWEDSAVPPEKLGGYLRDLKGLFERFGYDHPSLYGHFGQGCVHTRIPFGLRTAEGVARFHDFLRAAADLVVSYGGSLSGEHGDGQARGELLCTMYGDELVGAFGELKALFDPRDRMNPGKVVGPHAADQDLRLGADWRPHDDSDARFGYTEDGGSFNQAVMRCVGIGNCRSHQGGVMCPSYRATGEEEHSTRGRARLLFEMIGGHEDSPVTGGWRSPEVKDALDLCLACKGCKSDCPVGVDMATYKAEFLSHHYRGRLRPVAHYALGWLPLWARAAQLAPGVVNAALRAPGLAALGKRIAGVAERDAPLFAGESFVRWWRERGTPEPEPGDPRAVLLWPDTFSTYFHPAVARSAVRVLESAGFRVAVPHESVCCGLTLISTGQLDRAKRVLTRTAAALRPWIEAGTPVVGLEPSCTAVFRADAPELMPDDQDVQRLAGQFLTLSELLLQRAPQDWSPPVLTRAATVQTHCHQHAVTGFDADRELMRRAGLDADVLDEGCCGLAGNFGFERGHQELSEAIGELGVLPAVRQAAPGALVVADGFSCRTQIEQGGTGRRALHLAEALALGLDGPAPADHPEKAADRPEPPSAARARLVTASAVAAAGAAAGGLFVLLRRASR